MVPVFGPSRSCMSFPTHTLTTCAGLVHGEIYDHACDVQYIGGVVPYIGGVVPHTGGVVSYTGGVVPYTGGLVPYIGVVVP